MAAAIRPVEYFNATVADRPGAAYDILSRLAGAGINMLAFSAVPCGPERSHLVLFPEDGGALQQLAHELGVYLDGPHRALLVQGDDELGALARVHERLAGAGVNVFASSGVTDGRGGFGYVVYLRPDDFEAALQVLDL